MPQRIICNQQIMLLLSKNEMLLYFSVFTRDSLVAEISADLLRANLNPPQE